MSLTLRPYQAEAIAAVRREYLEGKHSTLLVLATGLGKMVIAADTARRTVDKGGRVLFLAHRHELLSQAQTKMRAAGVWADIEAGDSKARDSHVVIASVQSLKGSRLVEIDPDSFRLLIIDEAHHATSKAYRAIVSHFSSAKVLGLTATPDRSDRTGLGEVFESVAYRYELREGIRDGWLSPLKAHRVVVEGVDLSGIRTRAGDLAVDQLAAVMARDEVLQRIAGPLLAESAGRPTIAFTPDVGTAHALAAVLNRYEPGVARAVDGSAKREDRELVLERFRRREFRILINCSLWVEGFDEPGISCVAVCRPTESRGLYSQMLGRGTRLAPGKTDCLVLDFTGQAGRHRLIGPEDVLAGCALADDVRNGIQLDGGEDLEAVLANAEAEAARARESSRLTEIARYYTEEIDPFVGEAERPVNDPGTPASEKQVADLVELGLKPPPGISAAHADHLLNILAARDVAGLCSYKQARFIRRQGIEGTALMTKSEARSAMARIKASGFRPWVRKAMEKAKGESNAA